MPELQNLWPFQNPQTVRASAVLLAAGAYDVAPNEIVTANLNYIMLFVTYTRNGAGGAVSLNPQYSPYSADQPVIEDWFRLPCTSCTAQAGSDAVETVQGADVTYTSTSANAETFVYGPLELYGLVERIRIPCAESGAVGTPGVCEIVMTGI